MTDEQQPTPPAWGQTPPPDGQQPYDAQPYDASAYGQQPYGQQPYDASVYGQQPYGQQPPVPAALPYPAPYGVAAVDPATGLPWSDKSRSTAGLLQLLLPFVGVCGVGRLYAGQTAIGLLQLLGFFLGCVLMAVLIGFVIAPAVWLWAVVDGIVLLASGGRDQYGRPLR